MLFRSVITDSSWCLDLPCVSVFFILGAEGVDLNPLDQQKVPNPARSVMEATVGFPFA